MLCVVLLLCAHLLSVQTLEQLETVHLEKIREYSFAQLLGA